MTFDEEGALKELGGLENANFVYISTTGTRHLSSAKEVLRNMRRRLASTFNKGGSPNYKQLLITGDKNETTYMSTVQENVVQVKQVLQALLRKEQ